MQGSIIVVYHHIPIEFSTIIYMLIQQPKGQLHIKQARVEVIRQLVPFRQ
jgi:hypothetical protein